MSALAVRSLLALLLALLLGPPVALASRAGELADVARSPAAGSSPPRLWKLEGPPDRAKNVMCPQDHGHFCEIQAYFSNTRATVPPPDLEQHPELLFP